MIRVLVMATTVIGLVAFGSSPASATAIQSRPFAAVVTEDFSAACQPGATCGTAVTPYGSATILTVITAFSYLPSGCFSDEHTSTLTFADGSTLALAVAGTLCPTAFPNFKFKGTYSVASSVSSGRFGGATGAGLVRSIRENGPIHGVFLGAISLPNGS